MTLKVAQIDGTLGSDQPTRHLMEDTNGNTSTLGERIRRLRTERGWSQAQLATKLSIHQKQVSGYERGIHVPQTELLIRIAETFAVSLDHLAFANRTDTNHAGIADRELLEKLQALDQLPDTDRTIVKAVLDTYITKHAIQQLTEDPAA
ncbi:MAG: helix-turn-helix transcriptional regulator [Sulfitobacter sp.]|nr:helix-turn-helix transcriptional regulator [Sulfitobacter sp.]